MRRTCSRTAGLLSGPEADFTRGLQPSVSRPGAETRRCLVFRGLSSKTACTVARDGCKRGLAVYSVRSWGTYANEHLWLERFKSLKNLGNERLKRFQTVAVGHENNNGHRQRLQVLLEFDVLIGSQQRVERRRRLAKQRTVAQTGPAHLRDGASVVASQQVCERPR